MKDALHIDFETYSEQSLRTVGVYRYVRDPSFEPLMMGWGFSSSEDVDLWLPTDSLDLPEEVVDHIESGGIVKAFNVEFERTVWNQYCVPVLGWPRVSLNQWHCSAARAAAAGLPRSLDKVAMALNLAMRKDPEGARLIKLFCVPRKATKKDARTRIRPQDAPEEFRKFGGYCKQDVRVEKAVEALMPEMQPIQRKLFQYTLKLNERGIPIDGASVRDALTVVGCLEKNIDARVRKLSGGIRATQRDKMMAVFADMGVDLENMRAQTVRDYLKLHGDTMDPAARDLLLLRIEAGKSSTKKLMAMSRSMDLEDEHVRGTLLYHGAHTGRYAGKLIQPQNFIRGGKGERKPAIIFELLKQRDPDLFELMYEWPITAVSECMRGFIKAPDGYRFCVSDYTAIEARVLAWLCDERTMLENYRKGLDVYKVMATRLFNVAYDKVDDEQRRIAKNLVLGCGYQLSGPKFVDYCANAGLIIEEPFAIEAVKAYRKDVPAIVSGWRDVEDCAIQALRTKAPVEFRGKLEFSMWKHWLCMTLPSGRRIMYPYARAEVGERFGKPVWKATFRTEIKGKWLRESTYGGKIIENAVQGIAADVMVEGAYNAERNDYPLITTVHDELVTLKELGQGSAKELNGIICDLPKWTTGIPLSSEGFECVRYRKG